MIYKLINIRRVLIIVIALFVCNSNGSAYLFKSDSTNSYAFSVVQNRNADRMSSFFANSDVINIVNLFKVSSLEDSLQLNSVINSNSAVPNMLVPPANNPFSNAFALSPNNSSVSGTTVEATRETEEPDHGGFGQTLGKSVWYKWTAPRSGQASFSISTTAECGFGVGGGCGQVIAIYTGQSVSGLTLINSDVDTGANRFFSQVSFSAVQNQEYKIAVDAYQSFCGVAGCSTSGKNFTLTHAIAPSNDNFSSLQTGTFNLSGSSGSVSGTTILATRETGEPNHAGSAAARSVWYKWTAPSNGQVTFTNTGVPSAAPCERLAIYTGTTLSGLASVASGADFNCSSAATAQATFMATQGVEYKIAVDNSLDGVAGIDFTLSWLLTPPPQPITISGSLGTVTGGSLAVSFQVTISCTTGFQDSRTTSTSFSFPNVPSSTSGSCTITVPTSANGVQNLSWLPSNTIRITNLTQNSPGNNFTLVGPQVNANGQIIRIQDAPGTIVRLNNTNCDTPDPSTGIYACANIVVLTNGYRITPSHPTARFDRDFIDLSAATQTINSVDFRVVQTPNISILGNSITEGNSGTKNLEFTVSLSSTSSQEVRVNYTTNGGTAASGQDFQAVSNQPLIIPANQPSVKAIVSIIGDTIDENDEETFTVTLSNEQGANIPSGQGTATGIIIDDDTAGSIQFQISNPTVNENEGTANVVVTRTNGLASDVTVICETAAGGTATPDEDYTPVSRTLTFGANVSSQPCEIPIINDSTNEPDETVNLELRTPTGRATLGNPANARLTIIAPSYEGDIVPRPNGDGLTNSGDVILTRRFVLGLDTPNSATNEFQKADTAPFNTRGDSLLNSGDVIQTRRYVLGLDAQQPAAGSSISNAVSPFANEFTGQKESGDLLTPSTARTLSVVRTNLVGNTLTVALQLNTDTTKTAAAALNADLNYDINVLSNPTNVRPAPGSPGTNGTGTGGTPAVTQGNPITASRFRVLADLPPPQTFGLGQQNIVLVDFTVANGATGTTTITLSNIFVADVTGNSLPTTTSPSNILVGENQTRNLSISSNSITEGNSGMRNLEFTVNLSAPSQQSVTVNYSTANGTAEAGQDYQAVPNGTVMIPAGLTTGTATVQIISDTIDEDNEMFTVTLSNPSQGAIIAAGQGTATGMIIDDDTGGSVQFSMADYTVIEGDGMATITVRRTNGAASNVRVNYTTSDGTAIVGQDYTAASGTLEFGAGETERTFSIQIINDSQNETGETVNLTLSNVTGGATPGNLMTAILTIIDNDTLTLSIDNVSDFEGDSGTKAFDFTVRLSTTSAQTIRVNFATANDSAVAPEDFEAVSGQLTFVPGDTSETVRVLVKGDILVEPDEIFKVNLSGASGGASISVSQGTGLIRNDDIACNYSISPTSINAPAGESSGNTFTVTTQPGCQWSAVSNNSFIRIDSGASGSGSGTVNFAVLANSGAARAGTITVTGGQIFTVNQVAGSVARRPAFDFDGDRKADISVFRPGVGTWFLLNSQTGFAPVQFGIATDKLAPADYDGDGKTDIAVFRPADGTWYLLRSRDGFTAVQFGQNGDIPATADFDGDGRADLAVFRPSNGVWYLLRSRDGFTAAQFGQNGDKPAAADYDGDGRADIAVVRQTGGASVWFVLGSNRGFFAVQFGTDTDKIAPSDYDGDGTSDIAVFRPSNGVWYLLRSRDGFTAAQFGQNGDVPTAADYDGDGTSDIAVFRPSNGVWYLLRSRDGFTAVQFGLNTDKAVPGAFTN